MLEKSYQKEIEKLAKSKPVLAAFEEIDRLETTTVQELIVLTEIPAPPFMEDTRAAKFLDMLIKAGADTAWIDEAGNVLAVREGTNGARTVALDAHLDTVFPEGTDVKVKIKGDTLLAPGIGDDTRGLMVVLTVLRALEAADIRTHADLLFIGSVGEEGLGDLRGVKYIFEKNDPVIDVWISIDGGGIGQVNNSGLGSYRYKVTFKGQGGHSWGDFGLGNPHHVLGKAIDLFVESSTAFTSEGPATSFNVGRVGGGTSVNAIPFESWMEVDLRSVSHERLSQIDSIFKNSMKKALDTYNEHLTRGPALELQLERIGYRPSGSVAPETALVQRGMAATRFFGVSPQLTTGSTNSNLPIARGIPAITLGRGGKGGGAHSLGEWWLNEKGADAIKLALLVVMAEGLSR